MADRLDGLDVDEACGVDVRSREGIRVTRGWSKIDAPNM
jgi:hypothetical protein